MEQSNQLISLTNEASKDTGNLSTAGSMISFGEDLVPARWRPKRKTYSGSF